MPDDFFTRRRGSEEDYEVLGLTSSATLDEVTYRYHTLSKKIHPDTEEGSLFIFKQVGIAYERIRADRIGTQHRPRPHPDSARGRASSSSPHHADGHGPPGGYTPRSGKTPSCSLGSTKPSRWRWVWAMGVVLFLLLIIGDRSLASSADSSGGDSRTDASAVALSSPASAVAIPSPASTVPKATDAPPSTAPADLAGAHDAPPSAAVPAAPLICPTGTLTDTGRVSVVTDSISSGMWEAMVTGVATNDKSAPIVILSASVRLEDPSGNSIELPIAAGSGGATLNPGQSIAMGESQSQVIQSPGPPRVVGTLIVWTWPVNSPFESCPHGVVTVPNLG